MSTAYELINKSPNDEVTNFNTIMYKQVGKMVSDLERGRTVNPSRLMLVDMLYYLLTKEYSCLTEGQVQRLSTKFKKICGLDTSSNATFNPGISELPDITDKTLASLDSNQLSTLDGNTITTL